MKSILVIIIIFLAIGCVILTLQNQNLKDEQAIDKNTIEYYNQKYEKLVYDCEYLQKMLKFNMQNNNKPIEIPKGTIDAVKLAMKISHPDNGGNQNDFIKYREVYMKLTKKNG